MDSALDGRPLRIRLAQTLDDPIDLLAGDAGLLGRDAQIALVVAQLHLGRQTHHGLQPQPCTFGTGRRVELDRLYPRSGVRLDFLLLDGLGDHVGNKLIERFFDDTIATDQPLDHGPRGFPTPESGYVNPTAQAAVRLIDGAVQALLLDFDVECDLT